MFYCMIKSCFMLRDHLLNPGYLIKKKTLQSFDKVIKDKKSIIGNVRNMLVLIALPYSSKGSGESAQLSRAFAARIHKVWM